MFEFCVCVNAHVSIIYLAIRVALPIIQRPVFEWIHYFCLTCSDPLVSTPLCSCDLLEEGLIELCKVDTGLHVVDMLTENIGVGVLKVCEGLIGMVSSG